MSQRSPSPDCFLCGTLPPRPRAAEKGQQQIRTRGRMRILRPPCSAHHGVSIALLVPQFTFHRGECSQHPPHPCRGDNVLPPGLSRGIGPSSWPPENTSPLMAKHMPRWRTGERRKRDHRSGHRSCRPPPVAPRAAVLPVSSSVAFPPRVKLDPKVTRDEKAPSVSPVTR